MNIFINNRYRKIYKNESLFYVIYKNNKINITKYFKKDGVIKKEYNHLIQQKLKKVGGTGDKLVLCLLNVFTWSGYESFPINFDKEFKKLINEDESSPFLTSCCKVFEYSCSIAIFCVWSLSELFNDSIFVTYNLYALL